MVICAYMRLRGAEKLVAQRLDEHKSPQLFEIPLECSAKPLYAKLWRPIVHNSGPRSYFLELKIAL